MPKCPLCGSQSIYTTSGKNGYCQPCLSNVKRKATHECREQSIKILRTDHLWTSLFSSAIIHATAHAAHAGATDPDLIFNDAFASFQSESQAYQIISEGHIDFNRLHMMEQIENTYRVAFWSSRVITE